MKKIIEQIESFKKEDGTLNSIAYDLAICDAVNELKKIESLPFDPAKIGFKLTKASQRIYNEDPNYNVLEYFFLKEEEYLIRYFKDESKIWVLHRFNATENFKVLINLIKIPSHRFGVELLKNLGVIE